MLCSSDDNPLLTLLFYHFPLGVCAEDRGDGIDSHLGSLFEEPFVAVNIFGRGYRNMEVIGVFAEFPFNRYDGELCTFSAYIAYGATVEVSVPSADLHLVSHLVPKHFDTMGGLLW